MGNGQRRLPSQLREVLHQDAIQDLYSQLPASEHCFAECPGSIVEGLAGMSWDTVQRLNGVLLLNLPHHTDHGTRLQSWSRGHSTISVRHKTA